MSVSSLPASLVLSHSFSRKPADLAYVHVHGRVLHGRMLRVHLRVVEHAGASLYRTQCCFLCNPCFLTLQPWSALFQLYRTSVNLGTAPRYDRSRSRLSWTTLSSPVPPPSPPRTPPSCRRLTMRLRLRRRRWRSNTISGAYKRRRWQLLQIWASQQLQQHPNRSDWSKTNKVW